jgi:hypothetical protein
MRETAIEPLQWWLPDLARFSPDHPLRRLIVRADRLPAGPKGYLGGLEHYFACPGGLPAAALTRELLSGDAADNAWLSADPAWVQPDLNGARLLACGQLALSMDEADALARPLKPVFGDAGMLLEVSSPDRWHLRLSKDSQIPAFASPERALGEDLFQHLPQGADGRRWRMLINETQILLHQHPVNQSRIERGLAPVNSLWFWGGGSLPAHVRTTLSAVIGDDVLLGALARRAGLVMQSRNRAAVALARAGGLIDLQDLPVEAIAQEWWPALEPLLRNQAVHWVFASGERYAQQPWHRWRFWRKAAR